MVTGWWLSGLFIVGEPGAYQLEGLGDFSMNLLAPLTPSGWSSVLPDLPVESSGQRYEGFLYLGLGVLGLASRRWRHGERATTATGTRVSPRSRRGRGVRAHGDSSRSVPA